MLMLAEAGRSLNKNLESLFRHNNETSVVLERLVKEIHTDKELCSYMFLNHPGSEDMLWGLLKLLDNEDSRLSGNAAYVIGTLAEMDVGKKRIVQIFIEKGEETKMVLPSLTKMLDMIDMETVMNAAGTLGTLAENEDCRMWMMKEESLDNTIDKLTRLLSCKDMCTASNAALVLARFTIAEEGCARILRLNNSSRTLVQLCKALGTDETGRGMNSAFAIGRLCDLEAGCARILAMPESKRLIVSLISMLGSDDIGCAKNSCFALSCIASFPQGHCRLLAHPDIDEVVHILSGRLVSPDDELVWFAAMMLRTIGSQKSGCLYLRTQEYLKPSLLSLVQRQNLKKDTLEEVGDTLAILEKLPRPKPPVLNVQSAYSVIVNWEAMYPRSGLDVTYELYQDGELVYSGHKSSYIANSLMPITMYTFSVRAYTEGDEGHTSKAVSVTTPESVPSAPQVPRVAAKTTNQIKIMWDPPEKPNGILKAYQVVTRGKTTYLDISENYLILSGLPADTEYTFEIYALTSKGRGEAAILTARTDDLASHAPPKPVLQALGRHEILVQWDHPPRPLGRINSYEVKVNDVVIYTGIDKSCIARFLKPNTEYVITVSAWTSEGRCESLPAKKRTAREIYPVPIRKPLYPFDKGATENKRAKTAYPLSLPTAEGSPKGETKRRPSRTMTADNKPRPHTTVGLVQDSNGNKVSRRLPARKSSELKREQLSCSLDSLVKDEPKNRSPGILISRHNKQPDTRPPKGPRRSSFQGIHTPDTRFKPRSSQSRRYSKSSKGSTDPDDSDKPIDLTDALNTLKINKPTPHKPDEKQPKSSFAVSFKELKQVHRGHQPVPLESTQSTSTRLKKRDIYN